MKSFILHRASIYGKTKSAFKLALLVCLPCLFPSSALPQMSMTGYADGGGIGAIITDDGWVSMNEARFNEQFIIYNEGKKLVLDYAGGKAFNLYGMWMSSWSPINTYVRAFKKPGESLEWCNAPEQCEDGTGDCFNLVWHDGLNQTYCIKVPGCKAYETAVNSPVFTAPDDIVCLDGCPPGTVRHKDECIESCPPDMKEENGICVDLCTDCDVCP